MNYRVCIPTAGIGSRLGPLTKHINKSLVDIAGKPAISRIINNFPKDVEFVIALGHKSELVKEYLSLAHADRQFYFANVPYYKGEGSGLGLSLLQCERYLQQPFIFISCDTIIDGKIPFPDHNWMGYGDAMDLSSYRKLAIINGKVVDILEKIYNKPNSKAYIGLAGINNYSIFWESMHKSEAIQQGETAGFKGILSSGREVKAIFFQWHDTGTRDALDTTRQYFLDNDAPNILPKPDEAIWFVDEKVIKFSINEDFISQRVKRSKSLNGFVPQIIASTPHMYAYRHESGNVLSNCVTPDIFMQLLDHASEFWQIEVLSAESENIFKKRCMNFYKDKTLDRVNLFYKNFDKNDGETCINGNKIPKLSNLFDELDWDNLAEGLPGRFHGDFHFENIIYKSDEKRFIFLDWRQNFGGDIKIGDIYYDFAKLLHGLIVCHGLIAKDVYKIKWTGNNINFDLARWASLVECEKIFINWLHHNNYDINKTRILTALIYLNIAALHHYPYSLFLFALGKSMLYDEIKRPLPKAASRPLWT